MSKGHPTQVLGTFRLVFLKKAVVCPDVDLEALSKVKHSNVLHVQTLVSFKRGLGTG